MKTNAPTAEWLPTGKATAVLGISRRTLHRWTLGGLLEAETHYRPGLTPKSPTRWNPSAIEDVIRRTRTLPTRPTEEVMA
jgi:hypothetical protein